MIPPKLAQIMINLSGKITAVGTQNLAFPPDRTQNLALPPDRTQNLAFLPTLLDPFCGSGTILMEAALMGINNLIGSDISEKAISDTKNNLNWLGQKNPNFKSQISNLRLFKTSATEISKNIAKNSVDAIVTEPYLGPQRGAHNVQKTINDLEKLYSASLKEFAKIIKPSGRVVMIWPVFTGRGAHQWDFINPDVSGWQIINPLSENLRPKLQTTRRGTIVYGREGQKVRREIVVLKKV
jgi:tRNA G10  N-methylase Trm11